MTSIVQHAKTYIQEKLKKVNIKEFNLKDTVKKQHYYRLGAGIIIVTLTFGFLGTRNNAYAIAVNGEVVTVVKQKEEAKAAVENLVEAIKQEKGADIAVNETLSVEPVNKKAEEIASSEEAIEALNKAISYNVQAYEIIVDDEVKAIVKNKEVASEILTQIANMQLPKNKEANLGETVVAETINAANIRVAEAPEVEPVLESGELLQVEAALPEKEVEFEVNIKELKEKKLTKEQEAEQEFSTVKRIIKDFNFNEKVKIKNTYVLPEEILDEEEALSRLTVNEELAIEYTLVDGDNIWDIAKVNDTTMEHILEINPQIEDETRMQIGDVIKLEVPDPVLSLKMTEEVTYKEMIPLEIEYIEDKELYKDENKVKEEGKDGKKELTVLYESVNGKEIGRKTLKETVLEEPVKKVIAYGIKTKPKNGAGDSVAPTSGLFMHPLNGNGRISSSYGYRGSAYHKGIDLAAPAGTPIYAAASGTVVYSGYNAGGYGKLIIIDHGNGYKTYYGHNSRLYVNVGDRVSKGENIAGVGSTGNSTGNHVHFEIRSGGTPINPYGYIF